jgi:hypothetical protein
MSIEVGTPSGAAGANKLFVDANSAGRVLLWGSDGNPLAYQNGGAVDPLTARSLLTGGVFGKVARTIRASADGTLRTGDDMPLLYDSTEGAAVDTNKWIQTTTTMTITQAVSTGTNYNNGASVAATVGAMQASHRRFPFINRNAMVFRSRQRHTAHFNNNLIETGFADPPAAATTVAVPNGAFWRKDGTGQYVPVVSINGSEVLGTPISNATFLASVAATDYFFLAVFLEEGRATFRLFTQDNSIITEQIVNFGTTIGTFTVTHLQAFTRTYNNAGTGTAVQVFVSQTSVWQLDSIPPPYQNVQAGMNYGSLTSPTAFTQLANYANSAAPASATLSNTAAGYATLGGQWQFAAVNGAETDYALFAIQIPAPYSFTCTGVKISAFNTVVAVATTATILQWGLGFNASAVSLATGAPYPYMRKAIGVQTFPIGAAVGAAAVDVQWSGLEVIQPGRFFAVILKMPVGTNTATEIFRGTCDVEGYLE